MANTCRRTLLDALLRSTAPQMKGRVIDIGGKRCQKRGDFRPPEHGIESWTYVNNDVSTQPDCLCDAASLPFRDGEFDMALVMEVLEHVPRPDAVLAEAVRILRPGGTLIASMPFLYAVHADPYDFQRWTLTKHEQVLRSTNVESVTIVPMGGVFAVTHDLLHVAANRCESRVASFMLRMAKSAIRPFVEMLDKAVSLDEYINTGYFILAEKK